MALSTRSQHQWDGPVKRGSHFLFFQVEILFWLLSFLVGIPFTLVIELLIFFRQRDRSSRDSRAHCTHVAGGCKYLLKTKHFWQELMGFILIPWSKKIFYCRSPVVTNLSHCLQKCTVTCLGMPSEMSTWVRKQATHMLAGLGGIGTPHVQHRLEKMRSSNHQNTINAIIDLIL